MRSREVKKLLWDVENACGLLLKFTAGRTLDGFLGDEMLRSAVERQAEIVGEALKQAVDLDPSLQGLLHDLRRIIGFRNRLAHGYRDVSPELVWYIVERDVPALLAEVRVIMDDPPSSPLPAP